MSMFDLMGPEVKLSINSDVKLSSHLGVVASILFLILCCGAFVGFGNDIFYRLQPKVTFNRAVVDQEVPITTITESNFIFTIYDQNSNRPITDFDRRYSLSFDFFNVTSGSFSVKKGIQFETCNKEILDFWTSNFAQVGTSKYFCFPKNKTWDISGIGSKGIYTGIRIEVKYCQNNTDPKIGQVKTDCIPKQDTVKYLSGKRIQMHYIIESSLVDSYNFANPQKKIGYSGYTNTDPVSWSRLTINFKTVITDTDEGFFIETRNIKRFTAIDSIEPEAFYSPDTNVIFSHLLGNSRYKENTTRVYIKVQDIFAMMGGFINGAIIILKFLVKYFKRSDMINIFNNILRYENANKDVNLIDVNFKINSLMKHKLISCKFPIEIKYSHIKNEDIDDPSIINKNNKDISNANLLNQSPNLDFNRNHLEINEKEKKMDEKNETEFVINKSNKSDGSKNTLNSISFKKIKCCLSKNNEKKNHLNEYKILERKMIKTISFENLVKLTRYYRLFREILLNETQLDMYRYCNYPKSNKEISRKKLSLVENLDKLNIKLIENNLDKVDFIILENLNKSLNKSKTEINNFIKN